MTLFTSNKRKKLVLEEHYSIMGEDIIEKIQFIKNIEALIPNPNRFFEKLICFKEMTTDLEKILFFLARDKYNGRTSFQKSIEKELYSIKSVKVRKSKNSRATYVKSIIDHLKEVGLVNKIEKICPNSNCRYEFDRVPDECPECRHQFFLQKVTFPKESNRPYYLIEITEKGIEYFNDYLMKILKACYFCVKWLKYLEKKAAK